MATQIKLFQSVQSFCRTMGVYPSNKSENLISLLLKRVFFGFSTIITFSALVAFFLIDAETVDEYTNAFHGSISELCQVIHFQIVALQMSNVLKLIEHFEVFIEKRKHILLIHVLINNIYFLFLIFVGAAANESSRIFYSGINERIERMSKKFHFIAIKVSFAGLMIPPFLASYINYFINDLKDESFQLPYDGWYANHATNANFTISSQILA